MQVSEIRTVHLNDYYDKSQLSFEIVIDIFTVSFEVVPQA